MSTRTKRPRPSLSIVAPAEPPASQQKPPGQGPTAPDLGRNIKRLRSLRGWNLSRLATEAGLPQSTMSKVESGHMSLNFDKLWQLAAVLNVDVQALFAAPGDDPADTAAMARRTIDRQSDRMGNVDHYRFLYLSTELKNRLMIPLLLEVGERSGANGSTPVPMMNLIGERFAYVLEGPVEFHCAQYEAVTLQVGDSLYVDAAMPHAFVTPKGTRGKVLTVLTSTDMAYLQLCREAALIGDTDASTHHRQRSKGRAARK